MSFAALCSSISEASSVNGIFIESALYEEPFRGLPADRAACKSDPLLYLLRTILPVGKC